jgi:hypothetical protein
MGINGICEGSLPSNKFIAFNSIDEIKLKNIDYFHNMQGDPEIGCVRAELIS